MSKLISGGLALLGIALGDILLQGEMFSFIQWWLVVFLLGIIYMPLTKVLFASFEDKGYFFSKVIGISISGYLMWLFSSFRIMKFTPISCIITVGIGIIINFMIAFGKKQWMKNANKIGRIQLPEKNWVDMIFRQEVLFFLLFLILVYIRGFKPEAYGTEKFMDYGFMTMMMRADYMPPQDFWFAGTNLNYYYVGQFMATYLTKLSFVPVAHGYNLMLMMIGALAYGLAYSIGYQLLRQLLGKVNRLNKEIQIFGGHISAIAVCFAGNMHYTVYRWLEPFIRAFLGMEKNGEKYWFPDATRFIGYHPETNDKTIHEFPAYSFVLGDLHAHVINIIFVLTVVGILLAWMNHIRNKEITSKIKIREILHPSIWLIGFYIGLFHMTNFWDFPIYYVVSGSIILFSNLVVYNFKGRAWLITAIQGVTIMLFGKLLALPFTLKFDQISTSIMLAENHTPWNQLIILWGLPIFTVMSFLIFMISNHFRVLRKEIGLEGKRSKHRLKFRIPTFMSKLNETDLFVLAIGLCAIGLVFIPEIVYVKDIYSGDHKRANTMFKLTYQAFILFGVSFGYIIPRLFFLGESRKQKKYAILTFVLLTSSVFYMGNAVHRWYGNIFNYDKYEGMDASAFRVEELPQDTLAVDWLNKNIKGTPVVLEANGDSYTKYQRVSVLTGLPTVLGWRTHEHLWKSDTILLEERAEDIKQIYTSTDTQQVKMLIDKYNVSYIYVGTLEKDKYSDLNHEMIQNLGEIVYPESGEKTYDTYIIKIKD